MCMYEILKHVGVFVRSGKAADHMRCDGISSKINMGYW